MTNQPPQTGYAPVNGLQLYYEIHGSGRPLVLLHGGFGTVEIFGRLLPSLAATRQIVAVELQGHGHTADIDRPFSIEQMADDVAGLIGHLGVGRADLLGYSLGGAVALQTAIRHPAAVGKLIAVSAAFKRSGWYPEVAAGMTGVNGEAARGWLDSPMYQSYAKVAPRPEEWTTLADKTGRLITQDFDWSAGIAALKAPTLILAGDADGFPPSHAVEFFGLLGGGKTDISVGGMPRAQLAILPGTTHFDILERTDLLAPIITAFLDAPAPAERSAG